MPNSEADVRPVISVLMCVYNGELYLKQAVESILSQTYRQLEFVVVNDGSTDATGEMLDSYKDPRIVRVDNDTNLGLVGALNRGRRVARGQYIARMDADDVSEPLRLERQLRYLERHPEVGVLGTYMRQVSGNRDGLAPFRPPTLHDVIEWTMLFECPVAHATVMMRKRTLEAVHGYDPSYPYNEDTELWSRAIVRTRFANLPEMLYCRRWHKDSLCSRHADSQRRTDIVIRQRMMEKVLGHGVEREAVEWLLGLRTSASAPKREELDCAAAVLAELYDTYMGGRSLSARAAAAVRSDCARRGMRLAALYGKGNRNHAVAAVGRILLRFPAAGLTPRGIGSILQVVSGIRLGRLAWWRKGRS